MQYISINTNQDNVLTKNITDVWSITNEQPSDVNAYGLYVLDAETRKWVGNTPRTVIEVTDGLDITEYGETLDIHNCCDGVVNNFKVGGNSVQDGTPTQYNPLPIVNTTPLEIVVNGQIIPLPTNITLNGIGEYRDYIEFDGTKWWLHKSIEEVVFNGNGATWSLYESEGRTNFRTVVNPSRFTNDSAYDTVICSHFKAQPFNQSYDTPNGGVSWSSKTTSTLMVVVGTTLVNEGITTADAWKEWLSNNNITVQYVLKEPIVSELSINEVLQLLEGNNNIYTNYNGSAPTHEITYKKEIRYALEDIFNALSLNPTEYPIVAYGTETQDYLIDTKDRELIDALVLLGDGISTYGNRMLGYYPQVIQAITEFKALTLGEGYEVDYLRNNMNSVLNNAYFESMEKERIELWERALDILPLEGSTLQDRRDVIIARIRGQGKLNTHLINVIVGTFTGGKAISWVENSCLYVIVTPPPNNKQFRFENVEQEIAKKIPAHLGLNIKRNYFTWGDIKDDWGTWGDINDNFASWEEVYLYVPVWG